MVARNTHAAGQRKVPAGANNSAPIATIQTMFATAIWRSCVAPSRAGNRMIAPFFGKLAATLPGCARRRQAS